MDIHALYNGSHQRTCSTVGWGWRIHRLHLCRRVRPPTTSVLNTVLNNLIVKFQESWSFGERGVLLHCHHSQVLFSLEWWHLIGVKSMDQIKLNCVLKLNWIAWNSTDFWHRNCVLMLNWIVWNRTVFDIESVYVCKQETNLILNWIVWNRTVYMYKNGFSINNSSHLY